MKKIDTTATVRDIFTRLPETRHDANALVAAFWRVEQPTICKFGSAETLLRAFAKRELTAPETITRIGRNVQRRTNPELKRDPKKFVDHRLKTKTMMT